MLSTRSMLEGKVISRAGFRCHAFPNPITACLQGFGLLASLAIPRDLPSTARRLGFTANAFLKICWLLHGSMVRVCATRL